MSPTPYRKQLGRILREVRQWRGLSLAGVEISSRGAWKACVVGSYERGDRAMTVERFRDLVRWYGVEDYTRLIPQLNEVYVRPVADSELVGVVVEAAA